MKCKICGANASYMYSKKLQRADFPLTGNYYECTGCGFMFTDILDKLTPEEYDKFYEYPHYLDFDPHAKNEIEKQIYPRSKYLVNIVQTVLGEMKKGPKSNILIYGNGTSKAFPMLVEQGYNAYAYRSNVGIPNEIDDLASYAGFFDLVAATEVAEHFVKPVEEFKTIKGLLKVGGRLAFNTGLKDRWIADSRGSINRMIHYLSLYNDGGHVSYYSKKSISTLSSMLGMKNLSRDSGGGSNKVLIYFVR